MTLPDLLEKLKAATGPDRDLGVRVLTTIGGWSLSEDEKRLCRPDGATACLAYNFSPAHPWDYENPALSVDAALSLVERLLPGIEPTLYSPGGGCKFWCCQMEYAAERETIYEGLNPTVPALAILVAAVSALIAQQKEGGDA